MELKRAYRDIEVRTFNGLRELCNHSKDKKIPIDIEYYRWLILLDDRLELMDDSGYRYSIFQLPLETLIDILDENRIL